VIVGMLPTKHGGSALGNRPRERRVLKRTLAQTEGCVVEGASGLTKRSELVR
jgi:hypothetical protein